MYYWAYGSNLCVEHMRRRCPRAQKICRLDVPGLALVFRGVADVTIRRGALVQGGLWKITRECERLLVQMQHRGKQVLALSLNDFRAFAHCAAADHRLTRHVYHLSMTTR